MVGYYPEKFNIPRIMQQYKELELVDDDEEERIIDVMERKKRGKGAPKKAKSKGAYSQHQYRLLRAANNETLTLILRFQRKAGG